MKKAKLQYRKDGIPDDLVERIGAKIVKRGYKWTHVEIDVKKLWTDVNGKACMIGASDIETANAVMFENRLKEVGWVGDE